MIRELDLAGLSEFAGGTVDAAFRHHIKRAIVDCEDRPGENAAQRWLNDLLSGSLAEASVLYGTP